MTFVVTVLRSRVSERDKMAMSGSCLEHGDKLLALVGENHGASSSNGSLKHLPEVHRVLLEGDLVEVKQKDKGLRGSWHPAVVVKVLPGRRVVEYEDLVTSDGVEKLKETVDINEESRLGFKSPRATVSARRSKQRIRPRPPPIHPSLPRTWIEGTWVDCLWQDVWWEGILKENVTSTAPETNVSIFFRDEDDISKHAITNLRLTQDWDEKSGTWNWRTPLHVLHMSPLSQQMEEVPNNREGTDRNGVDQFQKCSRVQPIANITNFLTSGSPNECEQATRGLRKASLHEIDEGEENISDIGDVENGSITRAASSSSNTESEVNGMRQMLKDAGWKVSRSILRTGKIRWFYRSPGGGRFSQSSKIFSTLSSALSYYAERNINGSGADSMVLNWKSSKQNQNKSLASTSDQINSTRSIVLKSAATQCHVDHIDLSDGDARSYLTEMGWDVTKIVSHGGKNRWTYKPPPVNQSPPKVFDSLCGALAEYNLRLGKMCSSQGAGTGKVRIGLLRNRSRQASTDSRIHFGKNLMSNKRRRRSAEKKPEGAGAEQIHSEPNLNDFRSAIAAKANFQSLSDLGEMDHRDKLPAVHDSRKRDSDDGATSNVINEVQIQVNNKEARDYLRVAGWEVYEVVRKGRCDWYYKAPALCIYRAMPFQSLCSAISEYNRRVRLDNNTCMEHKPTIHLVRGNSATGIRKWCSKRNEAKSACTKMDQRKQKSSSKKLLKRSATPRSARKQGKRRFPGGADIEDDTLGVSNQPKIPENLLEHGTSAGDTSGDVKCNSGKTFGNLAGDVYEDDRVYLVQIHILDLKKEHLRIFAEKDGLLIKATYSSESTHSKISTTCSGALSCRLTLPDDAIQESVTAAQLKSGILHLTIPKSTKNLTKFEIPIR